MKRLKWVSIPVLAILLGAVLFAACGSDGDSTPPCAAPTVDVSGGWNISHTVLTDGCGDSTPGTIYPYLTQSGSTVTVSGYPHTGTICGNVLTLTGSYADGTGTTSETITLTVTSGNPMTASGTGSWTWTGSYTCSGTDSYSGSKY